MNIALLEQYAETLVRAPADVAKLRQLILSLAVRGKLVAGESDWPTCKLKELTTKIGSGSTPQGGRQSYANHGIPLIRSMNVYTGKFVYEGLAYLTDEQAAKLDGVTIQTSDVLLNITGASIGRVTVVPDDLVGSRVNQHVCILRPKSRIMPKYLETVLASPIFQATIDDVQVGATREALTKGMIESFNIPLPLAEQERIVARVDELMGWCDTLEAQLRQRAELRQRVVRAALAEVQRAPSMQALAALLDPRIGASAAELRQMILSLAVQGKLVAQNEQDGDVEHEIGVYKQNKFLLAEKYLIRQTYNETGVEFSLIFPINWRCVPIGEIAFVLGGKRLPAGESFSDKPTNHKYIRVTDMKEGTIKNENNVYISDSVYETLQRYVINKNDLYITIAGTIGQVGIVPEEFDGHVLTENAAKIVFNGICQKYLVIAANSEFVQSQFSESTKQMAQPKLAINKIQSTMIPLPPLAEQERIVARVDELMALVDRLEALQERADAVGEQVLAGVVG